MISPLPDVKVIDVDPDVEFMFLACDGIWNSMSSKEVVDFVRPRLIAGIENTSKICEEVSFLFLVKILVIKINFGFFF